MNEPMVTSKLQNAAKHLFPKDPINNNEDYAV